MSAHTSHGIRCGNRAQHGEDVVYHATTQAVKDCFAESGRFAHAVAVEKPEAARVPMSVYEAAYTEDAVRTRQAVARRRSRYAAWRTIPVYSRERGYYAVEINGDLRFFRVERPKSGKHAGKTFVTEQAGDTFHKMSWTQSADVLDRIARNPEPAAILYGQKIQRCSRCRRTLTDKISRERGIGPECVKKYGGEAPAPQAPAEPEVRLNHLGDPMHETPCICGPYDRCRGRRAQDAQDSGNWRDQFRAYND